MKTIEEEYQAYIGHVYCGAMLSAVQYKEVKQGFYAGSLATLNMVSEMSEIMAENDAVHFIEDRFQEVRSFLSEQEN